VICGKNRELFQQMEKLSKRTRKGFHLVVRGYVDNLADYIAASDVVVGKSGPNQVFETMIQERPLIISSFLANEKQTTDWVQRNGLGWLCRTPDQFVRLAARLASHPQILEKRAANIRALNIRSGAPDICRFLYELIEKKQNGAAGRN
jgi:UDP-N-acetylglucosamine:LPS N-acetylglucosamine transferase